VTVATFLSRRERFSIVGSTNDVVRDWLAEGIPEVCLAVADEQSAGRGREGRSWQAPRGTGLLLSLGFRPDWLPATDAWRLAAVAALAMAGGGEEVAGLRPGAIRLKWPNDLYAETGETAAKLGGVLGETDGIGTDDPRVIIGLGINADWRPSDFPPDLADQMTSLRAIGGDHPIDQAALLEAFIERVESGVGALRAGRFDASDWIARQLTTGRLCWLEQPDGRVIPVRAVGVDDETGALIVEDAAEGDEAAGAHGIRRAGAEPRRIHSAAVRHVRLSEPPMVGAGSASRGRV
jgi:BirA family transcriptional regulator, biotin operon repressor / biotin---[acetyl-CoA-carboxylase] ligase